MTTTARSLLLWGPRILGILVGLFVGVFALDALDEGIRAFLVHTMPAVFLLLVVAVSWRREWVGGAIFSFLAVAHGVFAWRRGHADWLLAISGPVLLVGVLFLWSWRHHDELHRQRGKSGATA
jgi:hypothetical protein